MNQKRKIALLTVLTGVFVWCLDSLMDTVFFYQDRSFWDLALFDVPVEVVYNRIYIVLISMACVIISARMFVKRGHAEEALRESEKRFRAMFNTSRDFLTILDDSGRILWVNPACVEMLGYTPENHKDWYDKVHPDDLDGCINAVESMLTGEGEITNMEFRYRTASGNFVFLETDARRLEIGGKTLFFISSHNITYRKAAEEQLAAEKERLAVTLRSIGDGVIATDREGGIALINRVAEQLTGWSWKEACGKPLGEVLRLVDEETRTSIDVESSFGKIVGEGETQGIEEDCLLISRDNSERLVSVCGDPIKDYQGKIMGVVIAFSDITGKRKAEKELQKADKLESVGLLAGGLAHDFNNILTAVLGNMEIAKICSEGQEKVVEALERGIKSGFQAKELTQRLLTFSRGGAPVKKRTDIAHWLRDSVKNALKGTALRCELETDRDLWQAEIDTSQMNQVLINLIRNADEAIANSGAIRIRAGNISPGQMDTPAALEYEGPLVRISIIDNGPGIDEKHLSSIFDPFFTTREKASGLGLAVSYSIVKRHGGGLELENRPGEGATFNIYLPAFPPGEIKC